METITVYADNWRQMGDDNFAMMMDLAELRGTITALANMDDSPEFVMGQLKEMVKKFQKEVDKQAA
jgi:hypothetical protein